MSKIYTLEYEGWETTFEVTDEAKASAACMESLEFFGDPVTREDDTPHEIIVAFLKFWGFTLTLATAELCSIGSLQRLNDRTEGLIVLDGSHGIKLIDYERWSIDPEHFTVTTKEAS